MEQIGWALLIVAGLITIYIGSLWSKAQQGSGEVFLRSKTTHSNRTLHFSKGVVYKFYKTGDCLIINSDDKSQCRDNFAFYGKEINAEFEPTNLFSKFVLLNIRVTPR